MSGEFLDLSRPLPYCKGCGHSHVLGALDAALARSGVPPQSIAIVTDIGCVGLADGWFPTVHTVHTLHGRSSAIAAGLRMARRAGGETVKPIVLVGDGGAGIGLLHLVHAAQLNVAVTVLLHNNLLFGMTGGQHSLLTLEGMKTATTPDGSPVPPLDLLAVLQGAGAGFLARTAAPGKDMEDAIVEAVRHPGFACVEILELCPTFAARRGGVTGKDLRERAEEEGRPFGVLRRETGRAEFAAEAAVGAEEPESGIVPTPGWGRLDRIARLVVAGRAGEQVQSAALLAASAAACAGLRAAVKTDNPVTQGTGFSLAELTVSPKPIEFTGLERVDAAIVTAPEGARELEGRGMLGVGAPVTRRAFDQELPLPAGVEAVHRPWRSIYGPRGAALGALVEETLRAGWWERRAWDASAARLPGDRRKAAEETIRRAAP